jgi:hypothetical protein
MTLHMPYAKYFIKLINEPNCLLRSILGRHTPLLHKSIIHPIDSLLLSPLTDSKQQNYTIDV